MADDISVLGIAVEQRGVKEGADALDHLAATGEKAEQSTAGLTTESKKASFEISSLAKSAVAAAKAYGAWTSIKGIAGAMIEAQQSAQKLRNSLEYSAGSAGGAAKEITYLREVTYRLGLDFGTASQAYAKFAAATKDTGVSAEQTKTVFEGIAVASAKIGLSADETNGALLALSQMASKGTVSAEELRGQLGELLPGAFKIAAESMGVTTAELGKMLEQGQIMASDFLPMFGNALKEHFQAPLNSLTQEIARFSSAWTQWQQELSVGTNGGSFSFLTKGLNESTAAMQRLGDEAGIVAKLLVAIGGFQAGAIGVGKFDLQTIQTDTLAKYADLKKSIKELEDQEKKYGSLPPITAYRLKNLRDEAKETKDAYEELGRRIAQQRLIRLPDLKGEVEAQQKKRNDAINAYLGDMSNAPKEVKIAAEVEKENKAYQSAVNNLVKTDKDYETTLQKITAAHNERIAEITKDPKSAGGGSDGIASATLSFDLERIKRESQQLAAVYAGSEKIVDAAHAAGLIGHREYYAAKAEYISANAQNEEAALQAEIDRLMQENATGKDRIENAKQIMAAQAAISKIRQDAATANTINGMQEVQAISKVAEAYAAAQASAQAYLDTVRRQNQRTLDGMGMGAEYRADQSARNQIEDKFLAKRASLDEGLSRKQITQKEYDEYLALAKSTFDEEIRLHSESRKAILDKQADWSVGAAEALNSYADTARNVAQQTQELFTNALQAGEDAFVQFAKTGKLSFSDLADSIIEDLARMAYKSAMTPITQMAGDWISKMVAGFGSGGTDYTMLGTGYVSGARASGGPVDSGSTYLVGEQGPELLTMGGNGFITPNNALGGGGMNVTINNTVSDQAQATVQPRMNNGKLELEVLIQQVLTKDMQQNGRITQGLSNTFGLARAV